jgi:hypothetical protein
VLTDQGFGVHHGDEAHVVWERMIHVTDAHKTRQMIETLRAYCRMDTLAMVEIHRVLRGI